MSTQQYAYSDLPERVEQEIDAHVSRFATAGAIADSWPEVEQPQPNGDGDLEDLGSGVTARHRFVDAGRQRDSAMAPGRVRGQRGAGGRPQVPP